MPKIMKSFSIDSEIATKFDLKTPKFKRSMMVSDLIKRYLEETEVVNE